MPGARWRCGVGFKKNLRRRYRPRRGAIRKNCDQQKRQLLMGLCPERHRTHLTARSSRTQNAQGILRGGGTAILFIKNIRPRRDRKIQQNFTRLAQIVLAIWRTKTLQAFCLCRSNVKKAGWRYTKYTPSPRFELGYQAPQACVLSRLYYEGKMRRAGRRVR